MKITEQELHQMIKEALQKRGIKTPSSVPAVTSKTFKKPVKESADYMAGRQVIVSAQQASLDFEKEIIKTLGLVNPDELHPNLRKRFNEIVETMKDDIVSAVKIAVDGLSPFPREDDKNTQKSVGPETAPAAMTPPASPL